MIRAAASIHVTVGGTKFVVTFNENDKPLAIKERRMYMPGTPYSAWYDAPLWHHSSYHPPRAGSRNATIIEEARKVLNARRLSAG